jgi:hypothetical protein
VTYLGYMALANDEGETLELVNAARVKAYTDNLAPSIGLRGCDDCEGLPAALGEEYTTPVEDFAPWYDPTDPATADFYGVYPLGFEGIDDSTRSIESAELTGDGSVVVGSRFTGQDIRVTGMAFAKDEAALYAGVSWLNSALNGTEEGRCFGDRLNVFSSCPPVQVLPPDFATPYDFTAPPSAGLLLDGVSNGRASTPDQAALDITGDLDVRVAAAPADWSPSTPQTFAAKWVTTGNQRSWTTRLETNGRLVLFWSPDGATSLSAASTVAPAINDGQPLWVRYTIDVDNGAAGRTIRFYTSTDGVGWTQLGADVVQAGVTSIFNSTADVTIGAYNNGASERFAGRIFSAEIRNGIAGTIVASPNFAAQTAGTTSFVDSTGKTWTIVAPATITGSSSELASWTTTSGTITSATTGIRFDWTAGDPLKVACREVTGLIPGEQYQLRIRPFAFGNYYVSMGRDCAERYQNLALDPRFALGDMSVQGSLSVDTRPTSGAPDGGSYFSRLVVTPNTTSPMGIYVTGTNTGGAPVRDDEDYTFSFYARKSPAGGPAARLDYTWYDSSGVQISTHNGAAASVGATWQRFTQAMTPPPLAAFVALRLVWTGTALAGQTLDFAQAMLNPGTTALDYIDGSTLGARWLGEPNNSVSAYSENVDAETIFGWATTHNPPTEPTVLDFVARAETMYLSLQSIGVSGAAPAAVLLVQEAEIRRVARPGVVAFGTGNDAVPPSDGWTHVAPSIMRVEWNILESSIITTASNPSGGSSSYTSATHGPQRTLFGLVPGSRYRLMVEFDASYNATGASAAASVSPIVSISNSAGVAVTYTDDNPGTFTYFWVVEFTATATSALLAFHPGSNLAIGSQGTVRWGFNEYMVEEILTADTVPPQPGRDQARTMYEVKASQGPVLTNVRTSPCGVMGQITYALRAGNPFKYRNPVFAGGLPAGTSQAVVDVPCSDSGLPQIVNFMYNPSVETNATDWLAGGLNVTSARTASATAVVGGFVFRATAANSAGNSLDNIAIYYNAATVTTGPEPQPGETLTVSVYIRAITFSGLTQTGVYPYTVFITMTGFPAISISGSVNVAAGNTWYRIDETFTLPLNIALQTIELNIQTPTSYTQGGGLEADGYMLQRGAVATTVFDETNPNAEWAGTPNLSAVLLNQVLPDISADPDCPAPPAPPAPPTIDEECIETPTAYNRTVVSIPADTVPRNLTAYPVITLTAGAAAVRQARIRFWENPNDLPIDDLDPCSYVGEIVVSYLAAGATMVIDGVLQEATISAPGFPTVNANHVLYGPDGGPVDWPELSGGIPYLVTLELDATEPYGSTLMLVDLVVRD